MSTEDSAAASNSLMESQAAAAAAVEPAVEVGGESLSFADFYRREHRSVLGLAFVLTGNRSVAEDTAQDAFTLHFGVGPPSLPTTRRAHGCVESRVFGQRRWYDAAYARQRR